MKINYFHILLIGVSFFSFTRSKPDCPYKKSKKTNMIGTGGQRVKLCYYSIKSQLVGIK